MNREYFQSRASNLFLVALTTLFFGLALLFFPRVLWISDLWAKMYFFPPMGFVLAGVVLGILSFVWYWLEKRYREARTSRVVRVREEQVFLKKIGSLSFWTALNTTLAISFVLGPQEGTFGDGMFASPLVYTGPIAMLCLLYLLAELVRWWRNTRMIRRVSGWGKVFSYRPALEKTFPFPARIFNLGKNGAADFVLEKEIAGLSVRIFQYSHTQRNNTADGIVHYSIISIATKDELPSFNLGYETEGSIFFASESEIDRKLHEEMLVSSVVPFFLPNGDTFNLSVAKKFEIEALQIFSKELVEHFGQHWHDFFIIGNGKNLIAVSLGKIDGVEEFKKYDDLAQFLVENIALRIDRIGKSVEVMKEVVGKNNSASW